MKRLASSEPSNQPETCYLRGVGYSALTYGPAKLAVRIANIESLSSLRERRRSSPPITDNQRALRRSGSPCERPAQQSPSYDSLSPGGAIDSERRSPSVRVSHHYRREIAAESPPLVGCIPINLRAPRARPAGRPAKRDIISRRAPSPYVKRPTR